LATRKFDPWRQKTIFEYKRRDVADSFEVPPRLFRFFLTQAEKYGGASDSTLQQLRYLREGVFVRKWSAEEAARDSLRRRDGLPATAAEDRAAFQSFAEDMRTAPGH
jgi:hypothetical protein